MPNEMKSPSITDGFHLVVDALKLNGIDTIYRRGRYSDYGFGSSRASGRAALHRLSSRAIRRKCSCDRRLSDQEAGDLSHGVRARAF